MPRQQPPKGYITSTEAKKILNVSGAMIAHYVEKGKIKHIVPPGKVHGFYLKSDVDKLAEEINTFFLLDEEADKTIVGAIETKDIPACIALNRELFPEIQASDTILLTEKWGEWINKNPDMILVMKREEEVIGIITILPYKPNSEKFKRILQGDISILLGDIDITGEDIEEYRAENRIELYIAEIGIKPGLNKSIRRKYGAKLISKLVDLVIGLGSKGVIVEDILSVGASRSGVRLLQHFGFAEIISGRQDTRMFSLDLMKSGAPIAVRYRKALKEKRSQGMKE